jgi:hypothetical protein
MIFGSITRGDDGSRVVQARNDNKRKILVQLNGVKISEVSTDEVAFDLISDKNATKISAVDTANVDAAQEHSEEWFGKAISEALIKSAYIPSALSCDRIDATKVFNSQQETVDFESLQSEKHCDIIVEFSELWFAKKNYGPTWNIVQVRLHPEPVTDTYPDEFAFVDSDDEK